MKIAVEGCAHGELDKIYEALEYLQQENGIKIDLLVCCGDFQSVRNQEDLQCMAVPSKYLAMNTFYKYYSGEEKAPILTLFVGGNHEASNYLGELAYGGWVCPNIYYFGYSGIINVGGVRIAGLSGIYKGPDYLRGHFEIPPYDGNAKRSAYHIRNIDIFRMKQIVQPIDVFLSHDWPRGVYNYGNVKALLRKKRFFKEDVETNKLGSRPTQELLEKLRPSYWFSAHLHVKFAAVVPHQQGEDGDQKKVTKFLALDKCLPRRDFLQILDIGPEVSDAPLQLHYDPEWLAILKSTDHLLNLSHSIRYMPGPGSSERWEFTPSAEEIQHVERIFNQNFKIPLNFQRTVPAYDPSEPRNQFGPRQPRPMVNPQTTELCSKLDITDPFQKLLELQQEVGGGAPVAESAAGSFVNECEANVTDCPNVDASGSEEVTLGSDVDDEEDDDLDGSGTGSRIFESSYASQSTNPDEISLDEGESDVASASSAAAAAADGQLRSSIAGTLPECRLDEEELTDIQSLENIVAAIPDDGRATHPPPPSPKCIQEQRPMVKALKRRNQAIYAPDDHSDEDN